MPNPPPAMATTIQASSSTHSSVEASGSQPRQPQPQPQLRPSTAIQQGADRLVELIEQEKAAIAGLYHRAMKGMEANHHKYQEDSEVRLRSIERKIEKRDGKINELQTELHMTRQMALESNTELEKLKKEHEALKASLTDVGLVHVDGRLQFNDNVSRVVDEFVHGVKIQQHALSSRLGPIVSGPSSEEDDLPGPIGPSDFFNLLSSVMDKARQFAESLGRQCRPEMDPCPPTHTQKQGPVWS